MFQKKDLRRERRSEKERQRERDPCERRLIVCRLDCATYNGSEQEARFERRKARSKKPPSGLMKGT